MEPYTTMDGDTADLIALRHYGETHGATEAVLRANPGLAAAGTLLPPGMKIILPVWSKKSTVAARIWS
jgi:phage tail protein X